MTAGRILRMKWSKAPSGDWWLFKRQDTGPGWDLVGSIRENRRRGEKRYAGWAFSEHYDAEAGQYRITAQSASVVACKRRLEQAVHDNLSVLGASSVTFEGSKP